MILLGSIERSELLALCEWWLSADRRLLMQAQGVQGQGGFAKASWESLAFVDEEEEESDDDKVSKHGDVVYVNIPQFLFLLWTSFVLDLVLD